MGVPTAQQQILLATVKVTGTVLQKVSGEMKKKKSHTSKFFLLLSVLYKDKVLFFLSQYSLSTIWLDLTLGSYM